MRAFSIILTVFLFQTISFAQQTNNRTSVIRDAAGKPIFLSPVNDTPDDYIFCGSIEVPAWIEPAIWTRYLAANLVLENGSSDTIPPGKYRVMVQFVIDKEGTITDVSITTDPGYGLGTRVKNVISSYKERWTPAYRNGRTCRSYHKLPITFIVEKEECEKPLSGELIL